MDKKRLVFFILILLLFLERIIILFKFSFQYTDIDQLIFWQASEDYASFIFHEPYFYGQAYYAMLSPFLAIPLNWMGFESYIALALISNLFAIVPFVFLGHILFKNKYYIASFLALSVPLILPIEYGLITGMSRGFYQGIFCCSLFAIPLVNPNQKSTFPYLFISMGLGYFLNPNSLILSLLLGFYLWLHHFKDKSFYISGLCFIIPFLLFKKMLNVFYIKHPEYIVHEAPNLAFDLKMWQRSFYKLGDFYENLSPIFWNMEFGALLFLLIIGMLLILKKENNKEGLSLLMILIFLLCSTGITKTHDATDSIFYSSGRMYLSLPYIFAIAFFWLAKSFKMNSGKHFFIPLCLGVFFFVFKVPNYHSVIQKSVESNFPIMNIPVLKEECYNFEKEVKKLNIDFVVIGYPKTGESIFINYAAPIVLNQKEPVSLMRISDRRTKHYLDSKSTVYPSIWLLGIPNADLSQVEHYALIDNDLNSIIIRNNKLPLGELMIKMGTPLKRKIH